MIFYFDLETRSRASLKDVGTMKYSLDPSTEVTVFAWAVDNNPVQVWHHTEPFPEELKNILEVMNPYIKVAHNAYFDLVILFNVFLKDHNIDIGLHWQEPSLIIDTMALGHHYRFGGSLDFLGKRLFNISKDTEGRKLMLKQHRLNRKTGDFIELNADEIESFKRYAKIDVELCRRIKGNLFDLPDREKRVFEWTLNRNMYGIRVDEELLRIMNEIVTYGKEIIEEEFKEITGLKLGSIKFKDWLQPHFTEEIENLQAENIPKLYNTEGIPPHVNEALRLKMLGSATSLSKVKKGMDIKTNGRIYETLRYHKAVNKRWGGLGIQIQNFPRTEEKQILNPAGPNFLTLVKEYHALGLLDLDWVKQNLRRIWLPNEGEKFYSGDFGRIEPETHFWFCGLGPTPNGWYETMAANIYNIPVEDITKDSKERMVGKIVCLAAGYGMGKDRFKNEMSVHGIEVTLEEAKKAIDSFRAAHPALVASWYQVENAFKHALTHQTDAMITLGGTAKLIFRYKKKTSSGENNNISIELPSGGKLYYRSVYITKEYNADKDRFYDKITYRDVKGIKSKLYGGKLVENIVSAMARELLVSSMLRLEKAGFEVLGSVHDEIWASGEEGRLQEFKTIMETKPSPAKDIRLVADCIEGDRYLK